MSNATEEFTEIDLETGETVYLVRQPTENKWAIQSYGWGEWLTGIPVEFITVGVDNVDEFGWQDMRFATPEDARAFVAEQIRLGKAPGSSKRA